MLPCCPPPDQLRAFTLGELPEESCEEISAHLDRCPACEDIVVHIERESQAVLTGVGQPAAACGFASEPQYEEALAHVKSLAATSDAAVPATPAPSPPLHGEPKRLGDYELLEKLGEGGMGVVYKARHVRLDKIVVLKVLPRNRTSDHHALARFEREMIAMGHLSHQNVVQAMDARDIGGTLVLVMEYVDGLDLGKMVQRCGFLPIADACEIVRQAAQGLQAVYANQQVHRDIKPSNLILTAVESSFETRGAADGVVKILDLGLALLRERGGGMTDSGSLMGTADYIAPEQAADASKVDIRADIYSLGCTLYKLLTGSAPFSGPEYANTMAKMVAHLRKPVPSVHRLRTEVPDGLADVLERMVAKDPAERYPAPAEVAAAIAPFAKSCDLPRLLEKAGHARVQPAAPAAQRRLYGRGSRGSSGRGSG